MKIYFVRYSLVQDQIEDDPKIIRWTASEIISLSFEDLLKNVCAEKSLTDLVLEKVNGGYNNYQGCYLELDDIKVL